MWFIFALLSGFCAAILAIIIKVFLKTFDSTFINLVFSIVGTIILVFINLAGKKISYTSISSLAQKDWILLIIAGIINTIALTSYLTALRYGKTCNVVAVDRLGIIFVVVFSIIFLQQCASYKSIFGSVLMILGAFLINS